MFLTDYIPQAPLYSLQYLGNSISENSLLRIHPFDLDDVDVVERATGLGAVPLLENRLVDEVGVSHRRLKELAAVKRKPRLFEGHRTAFKRDRLKARLLHLVDDAPALRAAELENAAIFLFIKRKCQTALALDEVVGIALGANEHERDRLVPQPADATPRGCHRNEIPAAVATPSTATP